MKRRSRILRNVLVLALLLVASAFVTLRFLPPAANTAFIDFAELKRTPARDDALACPPGLCTARVDLTIAPVAMSAAALVANIKALPGLEPRTVLAQADEAGLRYVLVQRSAALNLPDTINIAIQPLDAGHAALAIYSRSDHALADRDANIARVQRWLDLLGGIGVVG